MAHHILDDINFGHLEGDATLLLILLTTMAENATTTAIGGDMGPSCVCMIITFSRLGINLL